jgi:short-subunit dehydrogenase
MGTEPTPRPRALVTGASSGIGAAFADRLGREQHDLLIVARRRDRLELLAERLQAKHAVSVEVIAADLTEPNALQRLEQRVAQDAALDLVVNNAGFGAYMPFVALDPDRAEELIRLQVVAPVRLTRAALQGMIARGRGAVINVSSLLAFSASLPSPPLQKRAAYAGAKAYITTFTRILHDELQGTGVRVQALCPGLVRTEFHQLMGIDPAQFPPTMVMEPDAVVEASLTGLRLGEIICVPALADMDALAQLEAAERTVLMGSISSTLAQRYQT